jgi:uncharacterized protein YjbJ (UPF0337 family)
MNEHEIKGTWKQIKGAVQKEWGKLTDHELEQTKGDIKEIFGLIEKKYGKTQSNVEHSLHDIVKEFSGRKKAVIKSLKKALK